jgi:hypothetical protein
MVGKSGIGELTAFLRHYLAMASRVLCSQDHIYERFRDRCEREFSAINLFIQELAPCGRSQNIMIDFCDLGMRQIQPFRRLCIG